MNYFSRLQVIFILIFTIPLAFLISDFVHGEDRDANMILNVSGLSFGQSKREVFSVLLKNRDVLAVWPQPTESYYINADNIDDISSLKNAERLSIAGLGVSIKLEISGDRVKNVQAITTTSESLADRLAEVNVESLIEILRELIDAGKVDGVHSLPRRNPNNGNLIIEANRELYSYSPAELAWLFSYDRWDFSKDGETALHILLFEGETLSNAKVRK